MAPGRGRCRCRCRCAVLVTLGRHGCGGFCAGWAAPGQIAQHRRVGDGSSVTAAEELQRSSRGAAEELQKSRLGLDCSDALRCAEPSSTLDSTDGELVSACGLLKPAPKGLLVEGETRVNGYKGWLMSAQSDAMRQAGFRAVQGGQLTAAPVKKKCSRRPARPSGKRVGNVNWRGRGGMKDAGLQEDRWTRRGRVLREAERR